MRELIVWSITVLMAIKTTTQLIDDLDGSEASETIQFAFDGLTLELDLNENNANELRDLFKKYVDVARRVKGSARAATPATRTTRPSKAAQLGYNLEDIRAWAKGQGMEVADRGRIATAVVDAYQADQEQGTKPSPASNSTKATANGKATTKRAPRKSAAKKATASASN